MASTKVLVKIPIAPFPQLGKPIEKDVNEDIITVRRNSEITNHQNDTSKANDSSRVMQLEQNIRFLQEHHTQMLTGLHKEIDNLRHKNRELQFQLVFTKGTIPSSPSSPEDDSKPKGSYSPKQVNATPLQVEILEKEFGELKIQLQEIDGRNAYLSAIVDEQKKKLERYERDHERELERATKPDPELLRKLDEADNLIRRLRKENSDLRQDIAFSSPGSSSHTHNPGKDGNFQRSQNRNNGGRHRGNSAGNYRGNWFPPLHSQNYWNRRMGERTDGKDGDSTPLPSLTNSGNYQQNKRGSNNNHYRNSEGRMYRSGGPKLS